MDRQPGIQYLYKYNRYSLEHLCQYAERIEFIPDVPFPVIMALTEGYLYKMCQTDIKDRMIRDGIEMMKQAELAGEYEFKDQTPLKELDLTALLAWANRSTMYGGYNSMGYYNYTVDG